MIGNLVQLRVLRLGYRTVDTTTGRDILSIIQQRAEQKWGDRWMAKLVREYVQIAQSNGDEKATPVNRRPQIERAFKAGSCTLDTAIALAAAVGCRFQLACTTVEVIDP